MPQMRPIAHRVFSQRWMAGSAGQGNGTLGNGGVLVTVVCGEGCSCSYLVICALLDIVGFSAGSHLCLCLFSLLRIYKVTAPSLFEWFACCCTWICNWVCICTYTMLEFSSLLLLVPLVLVVQVFVSYLQNPVRKIPAAHPLAPFTSLWMASVRWRRIENATLKEAHERLGPIICLGPKEVSVNCVRGGIRDVYAGGFEKRDALSGYNWYGFFTNFG